MIWVDSVECSEAMTMMMVMTTVMMMVMVLVMMMIIDDDDVAIISWSPSEEASPSGRFPSTRSPRNANR